MSCYLIKINLSILIYKLSTWYQSLSILLRYIQFRVWPLMFMFTETVPTCRMLMLKQFSLVWFPHSPLIQNCWFWQHVAVERVTLRPSSAVALWSVKIFIWRVCGGIKQWYYACYKMPEPWAMTRSHLRWTLVFESPVLVYQDMITRWLYYDGIRFTPTRLSSLNIVEDNSKFTRVTRQWYLISLHLLKVWLS